MLTSKAAKRYAKAFFSLAQDKGKLDEVRADFKALADLAAQSEELSTFLSSPLVAQDKRLELLKSLFEGKIGKTSMSFISFLNLFVTFLSNSFILAKSFKFYHKNTILKLELKLKN